MFLHSGACMMPHPEKEHRGGEDSYFIRDDRNCVGVADGVGGWADQGVDPGIFTRKLMSAASDECDRQPKGKPAKRAPGGSQPDASSGGADPVALMRAGQQGLPRQRGWKDPVPRACSACTATPVSSEPPTWATLDSSSCGTARCFSTLPRSSTGSTCHFRLGHSEKTTALINPRGQ